MRSNAILNVIYAFKVKDKVSARGNVRKSELSLVFLDLFEPVVHEHLVLQVQISSNFNIEFVSLFFNLYFSERSSWYLPLELFVFHLAKCFVESCLDVDYPTSS